MDTKRIWRDQVENVAGEIRKRPEETEALLYAALLVSLQTFKKCGADLEDVCRELAELQQESVKAS